MANFCERFHRTIQDEFYAIAFRKKIYTSLEELQKDLDEWIRWYNQERTHSGKYCFGKTPWQTFLESRHLALEKQLDELPWREAVASFNGNPLLSSKKEGLALKDDAAGRPDRTHEISDKPRP